MGKKDFDVIIVGAGPAGLAAGYVLAKAGVDTIIIERGKFPGAKNVMGGILYRKPMDDLIPEFYKEAPLERHIIEQRMWLLDEAAHFGSGIRNQKWNQEPYNCFSVFRAHFDKWFSKQVVDAGALLINETVVTEPIVENGKVVGVRTDRPEGDLYADCVIAADGVQSFLAKSLGLRKKITPEKVAVATKEIIGLSEKEVNDRFGVTNPDEGVTIELTGPFFEGIEAMAWIYTNKTSVSIGVGAIIKDLIEHRMNPNDLLEKVKAHPSVLPLIEGGETKEYLAHMIPEGGYFAVPKLYTDGFMVAGDAAMLVDSVHREGSNLAIESGKAAAKTYLEAKEAGDFSEKMLSRYQDKLEEMYVLKDLKYYRNLPELLEEKRYLLTDYPQFIIDAMTEIYNVDGTPKPDKFRKIKDELKQRFGYINLAKDLYTIWRKLR
ncbi:FAD-dependent oxidoreductase [Hippea maritima]|uniref:Monooxygenase FAD-binding protein n=1 Tax=Hippea maritima (strain ATCC 700847 / DSM 10411 / MH2) TaxID=760142 RepID=F2LXB6_HIPMA|nr:FAD-dependent oxidoreductase [Hippea maritima]AEA34230.1 monooxygenase FAD-binding protein [Hippea maritima DSM 10411]